MAISDGQAIETSQYALAMPRISTFCGIVIFIVCR